MPNSRIGACVLKRIAWGYIWAVVLLLFCIYLSDGDSSKTALLMLTILLGYLLARPGP